ncbi:MAG: tetratricopeptide repeat protein [Bacteroidales bacterium]|nr:tetratricopeptide repeat protein [Bacteroidales bacterium]
MFCSKFTKNCPYNVKKTDNFIFVMMPFDGFKNTFDIIDQTIRAIVTKNFICERADSKYDTGDIWCKRICQNIKKAKYCIVDTTNKNANVFYELGFAHAIGNSNTIIITQKIDDAPFDIRNLSHILYSEKDLPSLRRDLQKAIEDLEQNQFDEYINPDEMIRDLEQKIQDKNDELLNCQGKVLALKELLQERQNELKTIERKLYEEQSNIESFKNKLNESDNKLLDLERRNKQLEEIKNNPEKEANNSIENLNRTIKELMNQLEMAEREDLGEKLNQISETLKEKEVKLANYKKGLQVYSTTHDDKYIKELLLEDNKIEDSAREYYLKGNDLYEVEKYSDAAISYEVAVTIQQNFSEAWFNWGLCLYNLGDFETSIQKYLVALSLDRKNSVIYNNLGDAYYRLQEFNSAINQYSSALVYNLTYLKPFYNRGLAYACLTQYDKAICDFNEVIKLDNEFAEAFHLRGLANDYNGSFEEALNDYNKTIELNPEFYEAYTHRAWLKFFSLKNEIGAEEDIEKSISINDSIPETFYYKGRIKYAKGLYAEAINLFTKAKDLGYEDLNEIYYWRGWSYYSNLDFKKAIFDFDEAIKINPNNPDLFNDIANTYFELQEYDNAIKDYSKAIKLSPDNSDIYNNRANTYYELKEYKNALKDYSKAIKLSPDNSNVYRNRANTYIKLQKNQKALIDCNNAIKLEPNNSLYFICRALVYTYLREYDKAIEDYYLAIKLDSENVSSKLALSELNFIINKYDDSIKLIEQLENITLDKGFEVIKYFLLCIDGRMLNKNVTNYEKQLDELLSEDIKINWSFDEIKNLYDDKSVTKLQKAYLMDLIKKIENKKSPSP